MLLIDAGSVNTTWKYGTGSRSASRAASHSFAAAPWHFGQCRLRQELYESWLCAHASPRATGPPSAAVRQLSIADITFNWPRLTWPALARRHAGPWPRKMSATSSDGRDTNSLASGRRLGLRQRDAVEWAHDLLDRLGGDPRIERRGIELGVPEQHLDHSDIDVLFQQVSGEAVPQGVERYALVDLGLIGGGMAGAIELARRHRVHPVLSREQPALWPRQLPPGPHQIEQMRGQHDIAILAAFALLDPDHHALAVDVGYLQRHHFGGAQSRPVGHAQRRLVFERRCRIEQARHLLRAEHHRQLARFMDKCRTLDDIRPSERDFEEEPQRRERLVESRNAGAAGRQVELVATQVFEVRRVGRAAEIGGEVLDPLKVVMLGLRHELADRHVF